MAITDNLHIPLIESSDKCGKKSINDALVSIDKNALPMSHVDSVAHWPLWVPNTAYALKDVVRLSGLPGWGFLECTKAGVSGASAPAGLYGVGDSCIDGTVTWTLRSIGKETVNHKDILGRQLPDQHPISAIIDLQKSLDSKEDKANKGKPDGYASLDSNGKVPVSQIPASFKEIKVVANISARNAITGEELYDGLMVRVMDATGDPTVKSGWAEYAYDATNKSWLKTAEGESLDVVTDWSNLQGVPAVLKDLSDKEGKLQYKGLPVTEDIRVIAFIGGDSEIPYRWNGTVQKVQINCADVRDSALAFSVEKQSKIDYIAKKANWKLVGGSQFTLPAGEVYKEYEVTESIQAGDIIRASTAGDDTGVTFEVTIKNN